MSISRRRFLGSAAAISVGFAGLRCAPLESGTSDARRVDLGPLVDDPDGILALPEGFSYQIISRRGERMDDGFFVPARHDGMATFPGANGLTVLVRNHEVTPDAAPDSGAFGPELERLSRLAPEFLYDVGTGEGPALGGTTTLVYDTSARRLVSHELSLAGTLVNCAGGPTPWGSWISCEEVTSRAGGPLAKDHGYNFEVPARPGAGPVVPVPLRAMGRFIHEAVAVQPGTGIVYQTEDRSDGLLYRFLPSTPGRLRDGGRLQALAIRDAPSMDLRNFEGRTVPLGTPMRVEWIDMEDVEAPDDDLRLRGFEAGAARFARGEGIWYGDDEVFVACTNGGEARKGQIYRYRPSPAEGRPTEAEQPGTLELFIEPNDGTIIENADNLTMSPWGDLVACEDGTGDDYLVCVRPDGTIHQLAHNLNGTGEFAGACFSPDGSTLFVNMQADAWTVAITGPWSG